MKLDDLEKTFEPIFAMYKMQRTEPKEAFGTFCATRSSRGHPGDRGVHGGVCAR